MPGDKPNVLLVGDQRYIANWGGRGQSIALYSLLSGEFPISDVVYGSGATAAIEFDEYYRSLLPRRIGNLLTRIREKSRFFHFCLDAGKVIGAKSFVTNRPEQSLWNLLKHRRTSPRLSALYDQVGRADVVVINGEGSGIFRTPFREDFFFYLAMIELASHLGKRVFYVNGILSDCPNTGRNTGDVKAANGSLAKCEAVLVRDFQSLEYAKTVMNGVNCRFLPDALFSWQSRMEDSRLNLPNDGDYTIPFPERQEYFGKLDFSSPYICIGGSSEAAYQPEKATARYDRLYLRSGELGLKAYLVQACEGDRFLDRVASDRGAGIVPVTTPIRMGGAILANARLLISGRYHPSIFASLGGTPCVFLGAHSHKMSSLQKVLEYPQITDFSAFPTDAEIDGILALGAGYLEGGQGLRDRIIGTARRLDHESRKITGYIREASREAP
jgi:polysaccharide pyruvyl transferase WcaK-like protein